MYLSLKKKSIRFSQNLTAGQGGLKTFSLDHALPQEFPTSLTGRSEGITGALCMWVALYRLGLLCLQAPATTAPATVSPGEISPRGPGNSGAAPCLFPARIETARKPLLSLPGGGTGVSSQTRQHTCVILRIHVLCRLYSLRIQ